MLKHAHPARKKSYPYCPRCNEIAYWEWLHRSDSHFICLVYAPQIMAREFGAFLGVYDSLVLYKHRDDHGRLGVTFDAYLTRCGESYTGVKAEKYESVARDVLNDTTFTDLLFMLGAVGYEQQK